MSKPYHVIALTGPASCGKDTVADLLVVHCGFRKLAFADPLRNEVADAFGIEPLYLTRRETKEHPMSCLALRKSRADGFVGRMMIAHDQRGEKLDLDAPRSPRQVLQWWGTDYRRAQDPAYWTTQTSARIHYLLTERLTRSIVISDCRFDNETDLVRNQHGGLIWQVKRNGVEVPEGSHQSETTGAEFEPDAVINNNHDMRHLQQLVLGEFWAYDAGLTGVTVQIAA
ncbi:MAG: hypothetical protein ACREVW_05500 [Burkholderiales bacterium]